MQIENATYAYTNAFVDELARSGMQHVVVCPGSRSTPLALTFADQQDRIKMWVLVDERSAAFFALGIAKATHTPVALVCTSGTAAANFLPAVAEANLSRVPLIVLTADRPPELRDNGAPQAIDQNRLYGTHAKWFMEMALPEATNESLRYARTLACRAFATAHAAPAGVVHLNLPFREPLTPAAIPGQPLPPVEKRDKVAWEGRKDGTPFTKVLNESGGKDWIGENFWKSLGTLRRGLIIIGPNTNLMEQDVIKYATVKLGYPILADPLSQIRGMKQVHNYGIIDSYDAFLRDEKFVRENPPDVILRFGGTPTSKALLQYIEAHPQSYKVVIDYEGGWPEPTNFVDKVIITTPFSLLDEWDYHKFEYVPDKNWINLWRAANQVARETLERELRRFDGLFEGRVFPELSELMPDESMLFVGNSMPVRDCDTFFGSTAKNVHILCNRGANGIDGVVSSALGVAAAEPDAPLVLVIGDLSFYHDMNGLLAAKKYGLNATIILINNDGGGIFSFLPQAAYPEHFEALYGTPTGLDFRHAVEMYGGTFTRISDWDGFRSAVNAGIGGTGLHVVEVPTNRDSNVTMHRQLWQKVSAALEQQRQTPTEQGVMDE